MFAILLSDKMDPFYQNVLSFPTIVFTILLVFCLLFWMVAILGMIDISFLDFAEVDVDMDFDTGTESASTPSAVAGIILKLGLNGVPLTIVITLIALIGWFLCYYVVDFVFPFVPGDFLKLIAGIPVLVGTTFIAALVTARLIRPLRPMFKKMEQHAEKLVMGQTAVVRTSRVDVSFGEATLEDGGAGLILKVRAIGEEKFKRGDKVVLIEHLKEQDAFRVVSEQEFKHM